MAAQSTRFRNSQLRLLPQCGWAYREQYVLDRDGQPSPALTGGQNVHAAVALAVREVVSGGAWLDVHRLAYEAVRGGDVEYTDALEVITQITESLADEDGLQIDPRAVFLLEEQLEMPIQLEDGAEVTFFGTPDMVERVSSKRVKITDWKTHRHPEGEEEFRADAQLDRYALLVAHHYPGFQEFHLVKRFVRFRGQVREKVITREELAGVRNRLAAEIEVARAREAADDLDPTGGSWCGLCAYHHTCPLIARYRDADADLLSIESDARASELAGAAIALDAAADRLKTTLKRYLGSEHASGAVPVSGGEYGYGPQVRRELPYDAARETFERFGVEFPTDLLTIDLKKFDRLCRRLPNDLVDALRSLVVERETSQCRFRRTSTEEYSPEPAGVAGDLELW